MKWGTVGLGKERWQGLWVMLRDVDKVAWWLVCLSEVSAVPEVEHCILK